MPHGACNNRIRARLVSCNFNELSYVAEVAWNKSGSPPPTICSKLNRFFFIQILLRFGRRLTSLLDQIYRGPSVPSVRLRACSDYLPRLSPENRPYVISSKPANGIGRRRDCFTLPQRGFARR